MQVINFIFSIAVLIMSVVAHELSHGLMANALGDPTAKYEGRLTINPLKHLDPFGSVLLPALTYLMGGFIFGWAKPVPYNPYNLKNQRFGPALVGAAGPAANLFIALFFSLLARFSAGMLPPVFADIARSVAFLNILLAVFNLVPIPPLDGSKVLFAFLSSGAYRLEAFLETYGFVFLLIFILFLGQYLLPLVEFIARLFMA